MEDLQASKSKFEKIGIKCDLIDLNQYIIPEFKKIADPAYILVMRQAVNAILKDENLTADDLIKE